MDACWEELMMSPPWVSIHGDPELTGLPGTTSLARKGAAVVHLAGMGLQRCVMAGYKNPKALGSTGLRYYL